MTLALVFCIAIVADLVILRFIPVRRRIARFVCRSIFFAIQTALIVALVGWPLRPAMMGFVLGLSLQGLQATSGIIALVLGLALQSTLGDVFSGISLSIEKPYRVGDEILLEGGAEGEVIEMNWRSTHLRNGANDIVIVPNSHIRQLRDCGACRRSQQINKMDFLANTGGYCSSLSYSTV